jgi:hypothetical protein
MSGVFRIIDPPPPHRLASVYPPPLVREVNSSEDARHCSVLSICKYFVVGARQGEAMVTDIQTG